MTSLPSSALASIIPYLPPGLVRAILADPDHPPAMPGLSRGHAAVLFADISGFTSLTERLSQRGSAGTEELTGLVNRCYRRVIDQLEAEGGEVITFSGDAVIALFPAETEPLGAATQRAMQAAAAMQHAMAAFANLPTSVGVVSLSIKISIGTGEVSTFRVGGVYDRWEYLLAGDPLRQIAQVDHRPARGPIEISAEAARLSRPVALAPRALAPATWSGERDPAHALRVMQRYVPGAVRPWIAETLDDWLAVIRPISMLFVSIGGLAYDGPDALESVQRCLEAIQTMVYRYEGSFNKLLCDDKGTVALILFGAPPLAHEDDPLRAVRCALDLQERLAALQIQAAIGVSTGHVFAGPIGGASRREYTVMGDAVNLAARLMGHARRGEVLCDTATSRLTQHAVSYEALAPIQVKGKADRVSIHRPTRVTATRRRELTTLVGREVEIARLSAILQAVPAHSRRVILLEGEAGIGKSRLAAEFAQLAHDAGLLTLAGAGLSTEASTPYRAWADVLEALFTLKGLADPDERRRSVRDQVVALLPAAEARLPLLNAILPLGFPESPITSAMSADIRHQERTGLVVDLLRQRCARRPIALVLDDAHWLDSLSWELAVAVARGLLETHTPALLLLALRTAAGDAERPEPAELRALPWVERITLAPLAEDTVVALAAARLRVPRDALPQQVAEALVRRTGGNPFFAEELVIALYDQGVIGVASDHGEPRCVVSGDLDQAMLQLPPTLHGLVYARIDRLSPQLQLALKVGAIIGRSFAYDTLRAVLRVYLRVEDVVLKAQLATLVSHDLTILEPQEAELAYRFKHSITYEVAYAGLLVDQRRQLHRIIAEWYEQTYGPAEASAAPDQPALRAPGRLAPYYTHLAAHYRGAELPERERRYAELSGMQAAAQYANAEAVAYLSRALELTPPEDVAARCRLLLAWGGILRQQAAYDDARDKLELALQLAPAAGSPLMEADSVRLLGLVAHHQDRYAQARVDLERALRLYRDIDELRGQGQALNNLGLVAKAQGAYAEAHDRFAQALEIFRSLGDQVGEGMVWNNLGDVIHAQGNFAVARGYYEEALRLHRDTGNRHGESMVLVNLGAVAHQRGHLGEASAYYEQAIELCRAIGSRLEANDALVNLGEVALTTGAYDEARRSFAQALATYREIGDRGSEAYTLAYMGLLLYHVHDHARAREHSRQALGIAQELGIPDVQGLAWTHLGHALAALELPEEATHAYREALAVQRAYGMEGQALVALAGLVAVALQSHDEASAQILVEEILAAIADHQLDGVTEPFFVYLTCYQALRQSDDARAAPLLALATRHLHEVAAVVGDEAIRRRFLERVAVHRELLRLGEG